jgi:malonyl-CoA/methylmalonyl-CoA synthetase
MSAGNPLLDALLGPRADRETPALTTRGETGERTLSYRDLDRMSARMARALHRLGARPGDRICVQVEKSPEALALYLACLRGGFVLQPLNPAYTDEEVAFFVHDARPRVIICDPARKEGLSPLAAEAQARLVTLRGDWRGTFFMLQMVQPENFPPHACGPETPAALLYTSGTTGRPKGAVLSHGNLRANAESLLRAWAFSPSDVLIHALPIYHAHGLFVALNVPLMAGARLLWHPRFDAEAVMKDLPAATVFMGVPTFYARLLRLPARRLKAAAAGMRLFISGSAPLSPALHAAFREATGHEIVERYGLTETGMNTSLPLKGPRKPGSVGPALPGVELRITDEQTGTPLPTGETGMVEVRGPHVFSGYWQNEEATAAAFRGDGWFITGDLGRLDEDGFLWLMGRARDLVITGGLNVYPAEVEAILDAQPGVAESAIIGLPDPEWGEIVTAVIVPEDTPPDPEELKAALRRRLAAYKVPRRFVFVEELPRNAMGKVLKDRLRKELAAGTES